MSMNGGVRVGSVELEHSCELEGKQFFGCCHSSRLEYALLNIIEYIDFHRMAQMERNKGICMALDVEGFIFTVPFILIIILFVGR